MSGKVRMEERREVARDKRSIERESRKWRESERRERERERERDTHTKTETDRHRQTQTDRQTDSARARLFLKVKERSSETSERDCNHFLETISSVCVFHVGV